MSKNIRIMLVDDDFMIRDCLAAFLEDEGYQVTQCESAEEALTEMAAVMPDLCISDLRMTGMNGEQFILHAHRINPETEFIIHTGSDYRLPDELRAIGMDADNILLKPVRDLSVFSRVVADFSQRRCRHNG